LARIGAAHRPVLAVEQQQRALLAAQFAANGHLKAPEAQQHQA
jgi:hypothetical protein